MPDNKERESMLKEDADKSVTTSKQNDELDEIFEDGEAIVAKDIAKLKEPRPAPSASRKTIDEAYKDLDIEDFNDEEQTSIILQKNNRSFIADEDIGYREDATNFTNEVEGDKPLHSKALKFTKKVSKSKAALLKLKQASGIGSHVNMALWHSGFYVTVEPMSDEDILRLELEITEELTRVGKATNTLVYSNYSILFAEVILKYFKNKIVATSLSLDEEQDILDYIHINDINIIATNMALSMYPNGFNAVIPCSNDTKLENGKPACSNMKRVKLDLASLQWEDMSMLTTKHIQQMNKTNPNTVSVDDVIEYQRTLPNNGEVIETFKLPYGDDDTLEVNVTIQAPNVTYYLEAGKDFINTLRYNANEIVKSSKQITEPEQAEELLVKSYYLQLYIHYIRSVKIDNAKLTTIDEIKDALDTMVSNEEVRTKFLSVINEYINASLVSIVGIPNFICDKCKQPQSKHELIPLAVYEYFFILLHSRYEKVMEKYQRENKNESDI